MISTIDLNGAWEFKAIDAYGALPTQHSGAKEWMPAHVPGTVHTDLMANGVIPDPFYRTNEIDVQWIDSVRWLYRRSFTIPEAILREKTIRLRAEGLDTYARIKINGKVIGDSANMFVEHTFELASVLKSGTNTIEVLFDSPSIRARFIEKEHGRLKVALEPHRVYVRKAQYSFGWDWGPKLTTSGIWRSIAIDALSGGRLCHPSVRVISLRDDEATVRVTADVEGQAGRSPRVRIELHRGDWRDVRFAAIRENRATATFHIPHPDLWWPNGQGDQPLYEAKLLLVNGDVTGHDIRVQFGVRTVRLVQEKDREGRSFVLEVNGRKIFCKGADWIPADTFIPRIPAARYESLLLLARDAHMNMIRVWGGGVYESDTFYELCDRLGLMVWQDFMFACGEYPDVPWFMRDVREEATRVVLRLRNHPSLVLWCGNNECEWLFCAENPGKRPDEMNGAKIFRDLLPSVCASLDGTRPYWRSTPFGSGFPNDESNGNHHQWIVWSNWRDFASYRDVNARFVSEFGFQAPANVSTMESCTLPEDRHPQSQVIEHHNKQVEGTERLFRFMSGHLKVDTEYRRFTYLAQYIQGEALRTAVEHWRRRKYGTAGALFWQLNDCWPVSSWAVVDSALRPKGSYYFAKRFFAPVLVSFKTGASGVEVWVTNDTQEKIAGRIRLVRQTFEGRRSWEKGVTVRVPADSSRRVAVIDAPALEALEREREYLVADLIDGERVVARNRHYFIAPKHQILPDPGLRTEIRDNGGGNFVLELTGKCLARCVRTEFEGEDILFDDNWVDIDPGGKCEIRFASSTPLETLKNRLRLEWLR